MDINTKIDLVIAFDSLQSLLENYIKEVKFFTPNTREFKILKHIEKMIYARRFYRFDLYQTLINEANDILPQK